MHGERGLEIYATLPREDADAKVSNRVVWSLSSNDEIVRMRLP